MTAADTALLGTHLVSVLSYLHRQGWLHLDVKPSNVVVQGGRAILIDLSVMSHVGDGRPHAGTYGYLAPEQVHGRGLSPAADVFGLGVTLGEALTGLLPYGDEGGWRKGTSARAPSKLFRKRLGEAAQPLAEVLLAAISPDPMLRPTLADIRQVLTSQLADGGSSHDGL